MEPRNKPISAMLVPQRARHMGHARNSHDCWLLPIQPPKPLFLTDWRGSRTCLFTAGSPECDLGLAVMEIRKLKSGDEAMAAEAC